MPDEWALKVIQVIKIIKEDHVNRQVSAGKLGLALVEEQDRQSLAELFHPIWGFGLPYVKLLFFLIPFCSFEPVEEREISISRAPFLLTNSISGDFSSELKGFFDMINQTGWHSVERYWASVSSIWTPNSLDWISFCKNSEKGLSPGWYGKCHSAVSEFLARMARI